MNDFIISAKHICDRDRARNLRQWIFNTARNFRGLRSPYTGQTAGLSVAAVIEGGRWIAACVAPNCSGYEYVRPDERIFYCFSCGNFANGGHARPVTFPEDWQAIEAALLARPVILPPALNEIEALRNATPRIPGLIRWWAPPTTLEQLLEKNREAGLV